MENPATSSLAALFQVINPALGLGKGTNLSQNQSVISGEQFGDLLRQLLGGGEGTGLDLAAMQQLLPSDGELLPLSSLGSLSVESGIDGGLPQDWSLELLMQQFKQLGQQLVGEQQSPSIAPGAPVLTEPVSGMQLLSDMEGALPSAFLMNLSSNIAGGNVNTPSISLDLADTPLNAQPTLLPTQILSHLKANQAELSNQDEVAPIMLENMQIQEEGGVPDFFKASIVPLMLRTSMLEGNGKGADSELAALTGLHSSSHMGDRSINMLKSAAEAATTGQMKSSWATTLDMPLASPQWKSEFGQRILMMTKEGVQTAELRLNPAHLGPIEVRITINDDQASINFSANHSLTREAIESSMPRLRDLFQSNGLTLADAQVSEQSPRDPQHRRQSEHRWTSGGTFAQNDEEISLGVASRSYHSSDQGLALAVDYYA